MRIVSQRSVYIRVELYKDMRHITLLRQDQHKFANKFGKMASRTAQNFLRVTICSIKSGIGAAITISNGIS